MGRASGRVLVVRTEPERSGLEGDELEVGARVDGDGRSVRTGVCAQHFGRRGADRGARVRERTAAYPWRCCWDKVGLLLRTRDPVERHQQRCRVVHEVEQVVEPAALVSRWHSAISSATRSRGVSERPSTGYWPGSSRPAEPATSRRSPARRASPAPPSTELGAISRTSSSNAESPPGQPGTSPTRARIARLRDLNQRLTRKLAHTHRHRLLLSVLAAKDELQRLRRELSTFSRTFPVPAPQVQGDDANGVVPLHCS